jgi:hypothetical protein
MVLFTRIAVKLPIFLLVISAISGASTLRAFAGGGGYVCRIVSESIINDSGSIEVRPKHPIIGQDFTVDRASGRIIGRYIGSQGRDPNVIEHGSNQQSFKVIAKNSWGYVHLMLLEVEEYNQGVEKPFLLVDDTEVMSGLCE